jgi:glycosyltransferase involved in cell wall biosynthesis
MRPLVSVILPVFNASRFVGEAVTSVQEQTLSDLELIVVDDESTDGSAEVVRGMQTDPRIRCFFQSHGGAAAARNHAIQLARGTFLAFLDADDLWAKQKLEIQLAAMKDNSRLDMVFGHYVEFHRTLPVQQDQGIPGYSSGTMLIRRESFLKVGLFATEWRVGEYIDWYMRAQEASLKQLMLPQVLLFRRVHLENMGLRQRDARVDYARIISTAIQRRRSQKFFTQ